MTKAFDAALALILAVEGGLVDHPSDPGGITNKGISIRFAGSIGLDLDGDGDTDRDDIIKVGVDEAGIIYHDHFWTPCSCDLLPPAVALVVFDTAVNQGAPTARMVLQEAARVRVDGDIGPKTLAAVKAMDQAELVDRMIAVRGLRYAKLPTFQTFGTGWFKRLSRVAREADRLMGVV